VEEARAPGAAAVQMFRTVQGRGDYPDAATPDLWIGLKLRGSGLHGVDVGAGAWRGRCHAGDLVVTPAGVATRFTQEENAAFQFTAIPTASLAEVLRVPDLGALHSGPFRDPLVEALCRAMWDDAARGPEADALFADSALRTLVLALARASGSSPTEPAPHALAGWRLRRCLDVIEASLAEPLEVATLAAAAGLSPVHFTRQFRAATGLPPHRYLLRARVERARQMLAAGAPSIAEVALASGFCSQEHLTRAFRMATGTTPAAYARALRN
jgi:AraC family transcriptional regulator